MLIGLFTLITVLLFGSTDPIFPVHTIEKGISNLEKSRKKEIKLLLKDDLKQAKTIQKKMDKLQKEFTVLFKDITTEQAVYNQYINKLEEKSTKFRSELIDSRIKLTNSLSDSEWEILMDTEAAYRSKKLKKEQKKKNPRDKKVKIPDLIASFGLENQQDVDEAWAELKSELSSIEKMMKEQNILDDPLFSQKDASKEQLIEKSDELITSRRKVIDAAIQFHSVCKRELDSKQWKKLSRAIAKATD